MDQDQGRWSGFAENESAIENLLSPRHMWGCQFHRYCTPLRSAPRLAPAGRGAEAPRSSLQPGRASCSAMQVPIMDGIAGQHALQSRALTCTKGGLLQLTRLHPA